MSGESCHEHELIKSMAKEAKERSDSATITLSALTEIVRMLDDSVSKLVKDIKDMKEAEIAYKKEEVIYKDKLSRARLATIISIAMFLAGYAYLSIQNQASTNEIIKAQSSRIQCLEELHPRGQK